MTSSPIPTPAAASASTVTVPAEATAAGWHEFRYPRPAVDEPSEAFQRGLRAAAPLIVAAELEAIAAAVDTVPDPAGDAWLRAETAGRRDVVRQLHQRAVELRAARS